MAERNGTRITPSAGNWPNQRAGQSPGSYYQNELGRLLPEPFPPPFPPMEPPTLERLSREYVAGGGWAWYGQVARTLPNAIDDVAADFGDDIYERMMFDPQVAAVTQIFKASILESGLTLTSAVRSRSEPDYELAAEIAAEAEHMMAEFDGTLDDILYNLLDCVAFGNKVAEQTYRMQGARKDGRQILVLDKLKVRPRRATVFAVDIYLNLVGLLIRVPPNASPWSSTMMFGPQDEPFNLMPPHKFVITNFRQKDNDPRGSSILRPAYSPWWRKQQIIPEYLKYLSQFAGPSIYGIVGPNTTPQPDGSGGQVTAEQVLVAALQNFRNGTAGAFANGTEINTILMNGDGAAFLRALDHCDQQITKAVLTQELATEEGKHMARAAAEVHQDVLDTLVRQGKHGFARQFRNQLFKRWVSYNWGDSAIHLAPRVGLGQAILREQPALWTSVSQMQNAGYLAPSQYQALDQMIGLPVRDETELVPLGIDPTDPPVAANNDGGDHDQTTSQPPAAAKGNQQPPPFKPAKLPDRPKGKATTTKPNVRANVGSQGTVPNSRGDVPGVTGTTPQAGGRKRGSAPGQRPAPGARKGVYAVAEPRSSGLPSPSSSMFASADSPATGSETTVTKVLRNKKGQIAGTVQAIRAGNRLTTVQTEVVRDPKGRITGSIQRSTGGPDGKPSVVKTEVVRDADGKLTGSLQRAMKEDRER